jgi:hypothetical protein
MASPANTRMATTFKSPSISLWRWAKKSSSRKLSGGALIPALQTGDINAIIAGMSYTEERDVSIDFSGAYYVSDLVAVVRGDTDLVGIDSIQA